MTEILCITHKHPPCIGGMEKQSYELVTGLGRHYKTHVIAYRNDTGKVVWFLQLRSRITGILKENPGIKLIHLNDGSMAVACLWLLKRTNLPVIVTFHGLDITLPSSVFQRLLIPKMTRYSGAVCVSKFTMNEVLRRGFNEKTTFTVNNGVDTGMDKIPVNKDYPQLIRDKYGIDLSGKHILFTTGRPVKRKGFSWFIKNVMPLLNDDIVLLMAGPLNTHQNIFQKAIRYLTGVFSPTLQLMLGLDSDANSISKEILKSKNSYHLGRVPHEDLLQLLSLADLFIMPNIKVPGDEEGFGLVALEANMRGTFVLASGIEGITDAVIDGENGYHLPAGDSRVWANTIHEVLRDKARLDMLSQKAKEYVKKNYSWDIMVEKYKEIFDSLAFSDTSPSDTSPTISDTYRFNFPINKKRLPDDGQSRQFYRT